MDILKLRRSCDCFIFKLSIISQKCVLSIIYLVLRKNYLFGMQLCYFSLSLDLEDCPKYIMTIQTIY